MKRILSFLTAMLIFTVSVIGATYYVSTSGSDLANGTSRATAWKTLNKVNSSVFVAGDNILFQRGGTWEGTLNVTYSGNSTNRITYGAYGTGSNPKIYGSEIITGWTLHSGNIYKATFGNITQLFVNGVRQKAARYPNSGVFKITSVNSTTQFTSTSLSNSINYVGAKWVGRTNAWVMVTKNVTLSSGNTLTLNSSPTEALNINEGFFLTNKLEFLDSPGEWYSDGTTVYLRTIKGDSPANYTVRGTTTSAGLSTSDKDYVTVKNIDFLHHKIGVTTISGSNNILLLSNKFIGVEGKGVNITYVCNNWVIDGNTFSGMNHYGIFGYTSNSVIKNNIFKDISLFDNLGVSGMGQGITLESVSGKAVHIEGNTNTMAYNFVQDIGYSGLAFFGANNIIEYNFLINTCLVKDDGGAIYTYGSDATNPINTGSIIRYNIIENVPGGSIGMPTTTVASHGVYLDNYTGSVTVSNNIIKHCSSSCVFLHQGKQNIVENNILTDAKYIVYTADDTGINNIRNNFIYGLNLAFPSSFVKQKMIAERLCSFVHLYSGNTYRNPYNSNDVFMDTQQWSDPSADSYSFAEWKIQSGQDATSTYNSTSLPVGYTERLIYNNTKSAKTYGFYGATNVKNEVTGLTITTLTLQPFTGVILTGQNLSNIK